MRRNTVFPKPTEKSLTVKLIKSLKFAPNGQMYEVRDVGETKQLRIRVTSRSKTFYVSARWKNGASSATSRAIGKFSEEVQKRHVTLAEARAKAREWEIIRKTGNDPKEPREIDRKSSDLAKQQGSFATVVSDYLARVDFKKQKRRTLTEQEIRTELLDPERNPWMHKHISEIEDTDIAGVIAAIRNRPAPYTAIHILSYVRSIFNFAIMPEQRAKYGLRTHPIAHLRPKLHFGLKKSSRTVYLADSEIQAFWLAADEIGYPYGPLYHLMLALDLRLREIAQASWPEFDLKEKLLRIPAIRFKSNVDFLVPLSDLVLEILDSLPRFTGESSGKFLFSYCEGAKPVNSFPKAKVALDLRMLEQLKRQAQERGENADSVTLKKWVNHDCRRTVRTNLTRLKVQDSVAEAIMGHGKIGLDRVYNLYEYLDEKREALQDWADHIRTIVGAQHK